MARRRTYAKYCKFNEGLAAARAEVVREAAAEEKRGAREAIAADALALADERAEAAQRAAAERRIWTELQEQRRLHLHTISDASVRATQDPDVGRAAVWQRAEEDVERRRKASARLQQQVVATLAEQVAARAAAEVEVAALKQKDASSAAIDAVTAAAKEKAEAKAKRDGSHAERIQLLASAELARRNKERDAVMEKEAEKERLEAQRAETARVMELLPRTAHAPASLRRPGTAAGVHYLHEGTEFGARQQEVVWFDVYPSSKTSHRTLIEPACCICQCLPANIVPPI